MDQSIKDILAIVTESGVQTRRERAAFVAKLRDEMGLTFEEIGRQLNVGTVRAGQLYRLHKLFSRRAPLFSNLSTRAYHFLQNIAAYNKLPEDWEEHPDMVAKLLNSLAQMTPSEALKFRSFGRGTLPEIEKLLHSQGMSFDKSLLGEAMDEEPVGTSNPQIAMQALSKYLNQIGGTGEFRFWPRGSYSGPYAEGADFVMTMSGILADAFQEQWKIVDKFDQIAESCGYGYEMATSTVMAFYANEGPAMAVDPGQSEPAQSPPANLDIQF